MWKAIILLGAPGSGKGTVAAGLTASDARFTHLSTGNMLREAMQAGTSVGQAAQTYIDAGELVPDEVVMQAVSDRLNAGPDDACYIFDGFPRTLEQAHMLDAFFDSHDHSKLTDVFLLDVPTDLLVDRIAGRLICRLCGKVYHATHAPPKQSGVCDMDGGELYQREDDNRETVLHRLEVYEHQTASLIDYYAQRGMLRRIKEPSSQGALEAILNSLGAGRPSGS